MNRQNNCGQNKGECFGVWSALLLPANVLPGRGSALARHYRSLGNSGNADLANAIRESPHGGDEKWSH